MEEIASFITLGVYTFLLLLGIGIFYLKGHKPNFKKMSATQLFVIIIVILTSIGFYISYWVFTIYLNFVWGCWRCVEDWWALFIFSMAGQILFWLVIWQVWYKKRVEYIEEKLPEASAEVLAHMTREEEELYSRLNDMSYNIDWDTRVRRLKDLYKKVDYKIKAKQRQYSEKAWREEKTPDMPDYHKKQDININISKDKKKR